MKLRVYLDTSVIGGCQDREFATWSRALLAEIREGRKIAVISDLTRMELEEAPANVRDVLRRLPKAHVEDCGLSDEARRLADLYIESRVVNPKHIVDAQHIAIASVERVDVVVSWNFRQIVNLERIRAFNSVNLKLGYLLLEIRSPRDVIHEEEI